MRIYLFTMFVLVLLFYGCAANVDYSSVYVPQESGYKFTQITDDNDALVIKQDLCYSINGVKNKLVFSGKNSNRTSSVFIKDLNNLNLKQQRTFTDNAMSPILSPDGSKLAFLDYRNSKWDLYLTGADKGVSVQQITQSGNVCCPLFSPDGSKLFYSVVEFPTDRINTKVAIHYTLWSHDLTNSTTIQYGQGFQTSFVPNTNKVCLNRNNEIWMFDLETGAEFCILSDRNRVFSHPTVSPSGQKIAFQSRERSSRVAPTNDIYVVNSDGTGLTQITFHPGEDVQARWGKDDSVLYFASQRGNQKGEFHIWSIVLGE